MATPPVNTAVSPAFDPGIYQSVEGYDDNTRGYVDDVISWANDCYMTLGKLADARKLADANAAWNEEQKLLIVGKEAAKQKERLAGRLDRAVGALNSRIEQTEGDLVRPVQQGAAAGPLAAEVRAHVKSLKREDRTKLLNEAFAADDEATLQAVLGGQPFLAGLSREDQAHYLYRYNSQKQPHLIARLEVMKRVRDLLNASGANGTAFHLAFQNVVGAPPARVSAIEKANRLAEEALKIGPAA